MSRNHKARRNAATIILAVFLLAITASAIAGSTLEVARPVATRTEGTR